MKIIRKLQGACAAPGASESGGAERLPHRLAMPRAQAAKDFHPLLDQGSRRSIVGKGGQVSTQVSTDRAEAHVSIPGRAEALVSIPGLRRSASLYIYIWGLV